MKNYITILTLLFFKICVAQNLIQNGNFEQGNIGFTSDLIFTTLNPTGAEGYYTVGLSATTFQSTFSNCNTDHSIVGDKMFIANGNINRGNKVWEQSITVQSNRTYALSFWYANISSINDNLSLQLSVNGVVIGQDLTGIITPCPWYSVNTTWNSGSNTTAIIKIVDNYGIAIGDDFAIDDIVCEPLNLNSGLVAYYPFNGNANDESGNGNNGIVNGASLINDRFGIANKAYNFNGNSDFIRISNNNSLTFNPSSNFTISTWVSASSYEARSQALIVKGANTGDIWDYGLYLFEDFSFGTGFHATHYKTQDKYLVNRWYHLVVIYTNGFYQIYINGHKTLEVQGQPILTSTGALCFGKKGETYPNTDFFKGSLDDIRIYNRALTSQDIKNLYYQESPNSLCVTWINSPTTGSEIEIATNDLCRRGIITSAQNATANTTTKITRGEIARLIFRALLADDETADARFPFLDFPTPYCDLRRANKNAEWYRAAMCLSYLEFGDGISPFSRQYFRFGADTLMRRRHFCQVLFESWNIKPSTSSITPFTDVTDQTVLPFYKKYIRQAADLGIATGTTFRPNDWLTVEEFYVFLYRLLQKNIPSPTIDQIEDAGNYFIPGNYTVENFNRLPSIDNGNFNHYAKTSFNIAGRGLPLEFTHTYNSYLTELPTEFFTNPDPNDETAINQRFNPLGIGWTHSYNIYIQRVNAGNAQCSEGWLIFWADGSINVYDPIAKAYQTQGVYDNLVFEDFAVDSQRVVITTKNQIRYTFTGKKTGRLLYLRSIEDRNNNALALSYQLSNPNDNNSFLQLNRVYEAFNNSTTGRALTFSYQTGTPFLQSVTDNIGRTIQFNVYDELEDLFTFTDAKGQITRYEYTNTDDHLLTKITLPKGNTIENAYQQRKLLSSKTSTGHTVSVNFKNNYRNGASGNAPFSTATVKTTKPNGGEYTTDYSHNLNGDPLSISTPSSTVSNIQYGTGVNLRKPTALTVNSQNVAMNYDAKGNLLHIARGSVAENFEYDVKNNLKRHIDARNNATAYAYDGTNADRNLIQITRPTGGGTVTMQRNGFGQIERITNPSNITTQYSYDANGNLNSTTLPLSISSAATYDNASRLKTMTDPKSYVNRFEYDNNDNVTEEFDALNQRTAYAYDANENLLSITNAKSEATTMTYSQAEDYLTSQTFGAHTDNFTYNTDGSLKQLTKPTATFTYIYDEKGRVLTDGYTTYTYDNRNRITAVAYQNKTIYLFYDDLDRLDYYTDYYGNTVDYGYDNNGNVTSITYPTNKTVTYEYDANNRMTTVKDWNNRLLVTYTYLTDDRLDNAVFHNGTRTQYGYDAAGRMTSLSNTKSNGTVISSYAFTLDKVGNHETETINEPAFAAALSGIIAQTTNYGTSPFNRLSSAGSTTFGFDGSGNETRRGNESLTFDTYNRLTATTNAVYDYDGSGNRRSRTLNNTTTRYVLDILGMSQILMETDAANTPQYFYVYGASGLICRIKPDNTPHFYHYDFRGSTTAMTDANQNTTHQYSYDPFGKILAATEADVNPFCYVGQHGVVYETPTRYFMRARYYDPSIGRFLSEDPIWNKNLYAYGENNPITHYDPDGNFALPVIGFAAVAGGLFEGANYVYENRANLDWTKKSQWQEYGQAFSKGATVGAASAINPVFGGAASGAFKFSESLNTSEINSKEDYKLALIESSIKGTKEAVVSTVYNLVSDIKPVKKVLVERPSRFINKTLELTGGQRGIVLTNRLYEMTKKSVENALELTLKPNIK